jgi:hypothetical protein
VPISPPPTIHSFLPAPSHSPWQGNPPLKKIPFISASGCVCMCVCLSLSLSLGSLLLLQRRTDSYFVLRTREEENSWKTWQWVLSKVFFSNYFLGEAERRRRWSWLETWQSVVLRAQTTQPKEASFPHSREKREKRAGAQWRERARDDGGAQFITAVINLT